MKKLKDLLSEIFEDEDLKINRYEVVEGVAGYNDVGKQLYSMSNIMDLAEQLVKITEAAHSHILSETSDWFDKISINRNMKSLHGMIKEFKKAAREHNATSQ